MENKILFLSMILSGAFASTWFTCAYAQDEDKGDSAKVEARLETKFNVSDARIDSLRRQGLGYGEINIVLSMAKQMPGGINNRNVDKIMDLRQGQDGHKQGWGEIAHDLNVKNEKAEKSEGSRMETRSEVSTGGSERFESHESVGFHEDVGFHGGAGMGHQR